LNEASEDPGPQLKQLKQRLASFNTYMICHVFHMSKIFDHFHIKKYLDFIKNVNLYDVIICIS